MTRTRLPWLFALLLWAGPLNAQDLRFGATLAVGEEEVIVGEPGNVLRPGTVYVFRRDESGWRESVRLLAPDAQPRDGFGAAVQLAGSTLFVRQGATIHIFERLSAEDWRYRGTVEQPPDAAGSRYGAAMAAEGDWLMVGAPGPQPRGGGRGGGRGAQARPGVVYVFRRDGETWPLHARLSAFDAAPGDGFGGSVALANGRALIGAPQSGDRTGAAYLFRLDPASGTWERDAAARGLEDGEVFGATVAMGGNLALVTSPEHAGGYGAAFVLRWDTERNSWIEHARLAAFDGTQQQRFAIAAGIHDEGVWVGAPSTGLSVGSVYLYQPDGAGGGYAAARRFSMPDADPSDRFGQTIAVGSRLAAVAAPGADHGAGVVVVYARDEDGTWREDAILTSPPDALDMVRGRELTCGDDGRVAGFECSNVSLLAYLPIPELTLPGKERGTRLNDIWGWYDEETGREYLLVGRIDGTSFVDVTDPLQPFLVGDLPQTPGGPPSPTWRDIKVYRDHAFIVADNAGAHGMQVFDLRQLRQVRDSARAFEPTALYTRIHSAHNVVINEESGFAYIVGAAGGGETCGGGLHMVDIRDPARPTFAGCFADPQTGARGTGYTHDAQCVNYRGPDSRYHGREICLGLNENAVSIADATDKDAPVAITRATYPNPGYTHQGWLTEDQRYFFVNDETDEISDLAARTRTLVWDLSDLENPRLVLEFLGTTAASDHNLYIAGNLMYQSNYRAGLRIIDVSDPLSPREVGFFDTSPYLPPEPGYFGSWSNYPYLRSGAVGVSSVDEGLFLVRYVPESPAL